MQRRCQWKHRSDAIDLFELSLLSVAKRKIFVQEHFKSIDVPKELSKFPRCRSNWNGTNINARICPLWIRSNDGQYHDDDDKAKRRCSRGSLSIEELIRPHSMFISTWSNIRFARLIFWLCWSLVIAMDSLIYQESDAMLASILGMLCVLTINRSFLHAQLTLSTSDSFQSI